MDGFLTKTSKRILLIVAVVCATVVVVSGTYAAYTSIKVAKRVISTMPSASEMFSSNYLVLMKQSELGNYIPVKVEVKDDELSQTADIYLAICNYAQGYMTKHADNDIRYNMTLTLVDKEGHAIVAERDYNYTVDEEEFTVSGADILNGLYSVLAEGGAPVYFTNGVCSIEQQNLSAARASRIMYDIKVDERYMKVVDIKAEAKTTGNTEAYDGYGLGGILATNFGTVLKQTSWAGRFIDYEAYNTEDVSTSYAMDSKNYYGFNYDISGAGEADYLLCWDSDKIRISEIFLKEIEAQILAGETRHDSHGNICGIMFQVGEDAERSIYSIQFYRVGKIPAEENWNQVETYVTTSRIALESDYITEGGKDGE